MSEIIDKYEIFLNSLSYLLKRYFEEQKEYIHCKEGCSRCCEIGEYPFSDLEFEYAMSEYQKLDENLKLEIMQSVKDIKAAKAQWKDSENPFLHKCPFLINKKCCIYEHRGIICRTHGLIYYLEDENGGSRNKAPECMEVGLNYSEIYNPKTRRLTMDLFKQKNLKTEPAAFNLSRKKVLNAKLIKQLEIEFGESKPLIDFFED